MITYEVAINRDFPLKGTLLRADQVSIEGVGACLTQLWTFKTHGFDELLNAYLFLREFAAGTLGLNFGSAVVAVCEVVQASSTFIRIEIAN